MKPQPPVTKYCATSPLPFSAQLDAIQQPAVMEARDIGIEALASHMVRLQLFNTGERPPLGAIAIVTTTRSSAAHRPTPH
jgi:hypothetical protein